MPENPYRHFQQKNALAEEEISGDSLLIALLYQNPEDLGVFIITKTKSEISKVFELLRNSIFLAGVGNYHELRAIAGLLEKIIHEDFGPNWLGLENLNPNYLIKTVSRVLASRYDSGFRSLGIELLLFMLLEPDPEDIGQNESLSSCFFGYRIKHDGDFHPIENYVVLGGYQKQLANDGQQTELSIRHRLLEELQKTYSQNIPNLKQAAALAEELIKKDPVDGQETISRLFVHIPTEPNAEAQKTDPGSEPSSQTKSDLPETKSAEEGLTESPEDPIDEEEEF